MTDTMKVPPTTEPQRRASFDKIAAHTTHHVNCVGCGSQTNAHVNMLCVECFAVGTPASARVPGPTCGFCGRPAIGLDPTRGESMVQGPSAAICSTCACAAAGCLGAKDAAEARGMMAHSSLQAEAVVQCTAFMRLAGVVAAQVVASKDANTNAPVLSHGWEVDRAELALTLTQAAELLGRIARGQS